LQELALPYKKDVELKKNIERLDRCICPKASIYYTVITTLEAG
jgi:hypothetical protein